MGAHGFDNERAGIKKPELPAATGAPDLHRSGTGAETGIRQQTTSRMAATQLTAYNTVKGKLPLIKRI